MNEGLSLLHLIRQPCLCSLRMTISILLLMTLGIVLPGLFHEEAPSWGKTISISPSTTDTVLSRRRSAADWWYDPKDYKALVEWQKNRWYHWVLSNVHSIKPNTSCLACFPKPLSQEGFMPVTASPASEALTRCLLIVSKHLTDTNTTLITSNITQCHLQIISIGKDLSPFYYRKAECKKLCLAPLILPDNSTDRGLRDKAGKISYNTTNPPLCVCRGLDQTCARQSAALGAKYSEAGEFLGQSSCRRYEAIEPCSNGTHICKRVNLTLPHALGNLPVTDCTHGLGMIQGHSWVCGDQYYSFLPPTFAGCCYLAKITTPLTLIPVQDLINSTHSPAQGNHTCRKRSMAQFNIRDFYHYRVSLREKWGIGLFPWYGVTFLADHTDNVTADLFAYMTANTAAIRQLNNAARNRREVFLKHEMVLDYLIASEGGMCRKFNILENFCCVLAPDPHDNITQLVNILNTTAAHFRATGNSGWSGMDWLYEQFGPWGALMLQILVPVFTVMAVMICFCIILLTCLRALIARYVVQTVGQHTQVSQDRGGGVKSSSGQSDLNTTSKSNWFSLYYDSDDYSLDDDDDAVTM